MEILKTSTIGELVAEDYRSAGVFKQYEIDFCCNGDRTIDNACVQQNIDTQTVIDTLISTTQVSNNENLDYSSWPLDLLADYIEKKHHRYVEEKTLEIKPYLDKVCRVHGQYHPELLDINELFTGAIGELAQHMKKEELILFPFVRKLAKSEQGKVAIDNAHFGTVQNPVELMKQEHETEGERFRKIAALSNNYTPPRDACSTYKVTYALLKEFEADLHLHIHLENNILFPKTISLEKEVVYG